VYLQIENNMRAFTWNVCTLYLVITGRKKETQFDCFLDRSMKVILFPDIYLFDLDL